MRYKFITLIFLIVSSIEILLGGLEKGTSILTSAGLIPIELLEKNNTVCSLDCTRNELTNIFIQKVESISHDYYFAITLKFKNELDQETQEVICATPDQLFYEKQSASFRSANYLTNGHILYKLTYGKLVQVECVEVKKLYEKKIFYSLCLDEPHLFFSSKSLILTHNELMSGSTASILLFEKGVEAISLCPQLGALIIGAGATILFGSKIIRFFKNILKKHKRNFSSPLPLASASNIVRPSLESKFIELSNTEDILTIQDGNQNDNSEIDSELTDEELLEVDGEMLPPKYDDEENESVKIFEKNLKHIFRKDMGHFEYDTVENRKLLEDVANNEKNFVEMKPSGTKIYRQLTPEGGEVWAEVFKGSIRNGGINLKSRSF